MKEKQTSPKNTPTNRQAEQQSPAAEALARRLAAVRPSARQLAWQQNEFTAFIHLGVNTFTGREWGDGAESPAIFAPTALDTGQWCRAIKAAGMRAVLLTAKHHDGFCLWHTGQTRHSVEYSPYGRDIAAQLAASCREYGLKLGFYLSPWDRHEPRYGTGQPYNDFFCAQLEELLTGYGPLYCVWFDGACGEGANGRVQSYDWERYYALIRRHQPDACISVCGPDVRWCGNEAGETRPAEWSVVSTALRDVEKIQACSQQQDDVSFREQGLKSWDEDLGSRAVLQSAKELCWYPAEVNTSIRPGWFYHPEEDGSVKPLDSLVQLYTGAVGGNGVFLLNLPPDTRGLLHEKDVARLEQLGDELRRRFAVNLAGTAAQIAAAPGVPPAEDGAESPPPAEAPGHPAHNALRDDDGYWTAPDGCEAATLTLTLPAESTVRRVVLAEQIAQGQRIEAFRITAPGSAGGDGPVGSGPQSPHVLYEGATVGYKRICEFAPIATRRLCIEILESRVAPTLRFVGVY